MIIPALHEREYYPAFINEETGISEGKWLIQGHTASGDLQMRCKPSSAFHTHSPFWM